MRKNRPFSVIAINPGWRYLGIAVFDCMGLREWRLKNLPGTDRKVKLVKVEAIISRFIERYAPTILAIKKLHPSRSSQNLKIMAARIEAICRQNRMNVRSYAVEELKGFILPNYRLNKKDLCEFLASEYPPLFRELEREKRSKNSYHLRLFEAVALGHVCFRKFFINNNSRQAGEDFLLSKSQNHEK